MEILWCALVQEQFFDGTLAGCETEMMVLIFEGHDKSFPLYYACVFVAFNLPEEVVVAIVRIAHSPEVLEIDYLTAFDVEAGKVWIDGFTALQSERRLVFIGNSHHL